MARSCSDGHWYGQLHASGAGRMDLRSESTHTVTESGNTPRLVEGQPVLDPIAKPLKTESGVSHKVLGAFLLVQPSAVVVV